ncbi:MAG: AAA family ATPase [Actinomycetota bacterium]
MEDPTAPRIAETHISYVILLGDRAYKLKKHVSYDFIDLSTRELREKICHREVELNRRLAPDVYLGVLDVVDSSGRPVDHLVEMRRLPDERRLATLVGGGADVTACLRKLAGDLAAFHADAETSDEIAAAASPEAVRRKWTENLDGMRPFVGTVLDASTLERITDRVDRYLSGREPLIAERASAGHARDGHGDLLADDIFCMDEGPRALDCIEFSDRLRWGDVLSDVAFLAMDLERLGASDAADRFLAWYREFSGESYPSSLADHYVAYRALIRSKVACLSHEQGHAESRDQARTLLALCDRRLELARIRLVLVGGLPGTGKSTLAGALSDQMGWAVLRSDEVRKDLAGVSHEEHPPHAFGEGLYSEEMTRRTYDELIARAQLLLTHGTSVILDASWMRSSDRDRAAAVAGETASDLVHLRCVLPADVAAERMNRRRLQSTDVSDADVATARGMAESFEDWAEAIDVPTDAATDQVVTGVLPLLSGGVR